MQKSDVEKRPAGSADPGSHQHYLEQPMVEATEAFPMDESIK